MRSNSTFLPLILLIAGLGLAGCGSKLPALKTYKMDIQQGNVVTSKMLLQLRPGMTKSQVRYIMGTPLVVDSFHSNRWDYFYQLRQQGKVIEKRRVILDFDKDLLTAVRGDVVAASDKSAETPVDTSARSVTPVKKEAETSWLDSLMFWKSEPPKEMAVEAAVGAAANTKAAVSAGASTTAEVAAATAVVATEAAATSETAEPESVLRQKIEPLLTPESEVSVPAVAVTESSAAPAEVAPAAVEAAPAVVVVPAESTQTTPPLAQDVPQDAQRVAVNDAVTQWADAWRTKNTVAYLGAYADKFKPDGGLSKKAWVNQRKKRLSDKQGAINLVLDDVAVDVRGNLATVQFFQQYSSKVFSDQVMKQLTLELDAKTQRWLIVKESAMPNAQRQPQQKVLAPEDTSEHLDGVIEKIGF